MSQIADFAILDQLCDKLTQQSIATDDKASFANAETMCHTLLDQSDVDDDDRQLLTTHASSKRRYPADAEYLLKSLGVWSKSLGATDVQRSLKSSFIFTDGEQAIWADKKCKPITGASIGDVYHKGKLVDPDNCSVLYQNQLVQVVKYVFRSEERQNRVYRAVKHMLSKPAISMMLMPHRKYAFYFGIRLAIMDQYRLFESEWKTHMADKELQELTGKNESLREEAFDLQRTLYSMDKKLSYMTTELHTGRVEAKEAATRHDFNLKEVKRHIGGQLDHVAKLLKKKSITSTMNPQSESLQHGFLAMSYRFVNDEGIECTHLQFTAGQNRRLRTVMRNCDNDTKHEWKDEIEAHYNANPVDLRNNITNRVEAFIAERIEEVNDERRSAVEHHNMVLRRDIKRHNKTRPKNPRSYSAEKISAVLLERIPIDHSNLRSTYMSNEFISFEEYLDVIRSVDVATKRSPYPTTSDAEEESEASGTDVEDSDDE